MIFSSAFRQLVPRQLRPRLAGLLALMLASALTEGFGLVLLAPMLGALGGGSGTDPVTRTLAALGLPMALGPLLALFVALVALRAVLNFARGLAAMRFEMAVVDGLRARAWDALLHCDWRVLSAMRLSDSASQLITNVDRTGFAVFQALSATAVMVTLIGLAAAGLAIAPVIAACAILGGIAVLAAYRRVRARASAIGEQLNTAYEEVYARFDEGLGALRVIKSFGREDQTAREGAAAITGMRRVQVTFARDAGLAQAALQASGALLLAGLVWVAITRWHAGMAQILPLVALSVRALPQIGALQQAWQNWAHARPAFDSVMALTERAEAAREPAPAVEQAAPSLRQALTLVGARVHFEGRDRPALDGVDLAIPAGSIVALTGPSGAGKSTIADLIGGLIAPDAGEVRVDGAALAGGLRRAWRTRVTYVQQEPVLFGGTIRDNLRWGSPAADEPAMRAVLARASAGFVLDLPDGLDTRVGESGRQLSGGERQRIVLARALLRDPELLILDEAASALDAENESAIAAAIAQLRGQLTVVIIGHRGALAELADRVVRLEAGRITG